MRDRSAPAAEPAPERGESGAGVTHERQCAVLGRVGGVDVDPDETHARVLKLGLGSRREVGKARADADHDVGLGRDAIGRERAGDAHRAESERVGFEQRALAGLRDTDWDAGGIGELLQCGGRIRIMHAAAGDDQRTLGLAQERGGLA